MIDNELLKRSSQYMADANRPVSINKISLGQLHYEKTTDVSTFVISKRFSVCSSVAK